ncbi:MAG: Lpg1974 family pore-forming outer membrane protein [Rhabdochlamydiaceae bacterium]|nr:Lpg1974 family pore-forming outer membrane protein [Candidatus Amphrikana amoebophyrae]
MKWNMLFASIVCPIMGFCLSVDERVSQLEKKMSSVYTKNEMDGSGAKNGNALPENEVTNWHFQAGFSYLLPSVQGSDYCTKNNIALSSLSSSNSKLTHEIINADFEWNWGFMVGAGYKVPEYNYDIEINYNRFLNRSSNKVATGPNGVLGQVRAFANLADVSSFTECTSATSDYSIDFDMLDLTMTTAFFTNRVFVLEFLAGLRSHWINLNQRINYSGGTFLGVNSWRIDDKSNYWGIGPVAGFNSKWNFGKGFGLYSNLNFGYLYGRFNVSKNQTNTRDNFTQNDTGDKHSGILELNSVLGLRYDSYFMNHDHHVSVSLGYDFGYYWSVNQMIVNRDDLAFMGPAYVNGNMDVHGLVGELRFDF